MAAAFLLRFSFFPRVSSIAHFGTPSNTSVKRKPYRIGVLTGQKTVHGAFIDKNKRRAAESVADDLFLRKLVSGTLGVHNMLANWFPIIIQRRNNEVTVVAGVRRSAASSLSRLWWLKGYIQTLESKRTGCQVTLELKIV
eukprot:m.74640 g.74640  ORF g.74640 m.74640 type:complete len:140 (+) comp35900_c0_seq2:241-660(+)